MIATKRLFSCGLLSVWLALFGVFSSFEQVAAVHVNGWYECHGRLPTTSYKEDEKLESWMEKRVRQNNLRKRPWDRAKASDYFEMSIQEQREFRQDKEHSETAFKRQTVQAFTVEEKLKNISGT